MVGLQKLGDSAAPQKYWQQYVGVDGQPLALASGSPGQVLVELVVEVDVIDVKQLQALETREVPQVATTVGVAKVLFKEEFSF